MNKKEEIEMKVVTFADEQPCTSAAALAAMRDREDEAIQLQKLTNPRSKFYIGPQTADGDDSEERERARYFRNQISPLGRRTTIYVFLTTVILSLVKIVSCLGVLLTDMELDHLCKVDECHHLVYTADAAIYFVASMVLLCLSLAQLFIGLNIFTSYPDKRCLLVLANVTTKKILKKMKYYVGITGAEIFVVILAGVTAHPGPLIIIPVTIIIGTELVAFLCVLLHPYFERSALWRRIQSHNRRLV